MSLYEKLFDKFILGENIEAPSIKTYIQTAMETLSHIRPSNQGDRHRLAMIKESLYNIKRHTRRLEEHITFLEEEMKILQEKKTQEE